MHIQFNSPSTTGTCKPTKILLLMLEKFMKNLAVPLACCGNSFMQSQVVIQLVISLMFQTSIVLTSIIRYFNMIVKLDLSNIITEAVNNNVTTLSKSMFTVLRKWKGLLTLEWDNTMN